MKLTIERGALLKSLAHVQSVVERRNTIPILSNLLVEAGESTLALTATDMDLTVVETMAAEVAEAGATRIPAHTFYDIVRKLPEGAQIRLESGADGGQIALRAGRSRFVLPTLPKDDFPAMGTGDLPHEFGLPAADLRSLIDRTRFAISTEETRYYLNGIYLHATTGDGADVLRAVATDGHRLARVEGALPPGAPGMAGGVGARQRGSPPRPRPRAAGGGAPRVSTISSERSRAVKLSLKNGSLVLSATSPESCSASEELEVTYEGAAMEIGFNARYLLDVTQQILGEDAQFALADAASPTLVR